MTDRDIVLDFRRPYLCDELFDDEMMGRLNTLGTVHRLDPSTPGPKTADILVTGWDTPHLIGPREQLPKLLVHSGGSVRLIASKAMIADGLHVSQARVAMARSVAELCLFYTLALLRDLHVIDHAMRADRDWRTAYAVPLGHTVHGARIGVVGASQVGRAYIEIVNALGANVVVSDPYLTEAEASRLGVALSSLDELLSWADVVALHAPVTDETRGMIDDRRLSLIRDGGALLNTAREAILDTEALTRHLLTGRIRAALDVFEPEPLPETSSLWSLPNVILTPHIGARTIESRRGQGKIVIDEIERFINNQPLLYEIGVDDYDRLA